AGTLSGLYRIDATRTRVDAFYPDPPLERASSAERLRDIKITPDGKVWIATLGMGVAIFGPHTETFEYLLHRPGAATSLPSYNVGHVAMESAGILSLGTVRAVSRV